MSYKTASKPKVKTAQATVATIEKKPGAMKTLHYGKSGKLHGLNPKVLGAAGKLKAAYEAQTPVAAQLHDAGYGLKFVDDATDVLEMNPRERETELADKLVAEVADHGADVNVLCETYELKREELGRLTGFSLRALAEWASGKLPSQPAKRRLQEVRRLLDALSEIVKRESIKRWLHQPNPAFDRMTPLQVIEVGEMDRLWAMVHDLGSGQPE